MKNDYNKEDLIRGLKKIGQFIEWGLAPDSVIKTYTRLMTISKNKKIEAWRFNGFYLNFCDLINSHKVLNKIPLNIDTFEEAVNYFNKEAIVQLLDNWDLNHELFSKLFPKYKELNRNTLKGGMIKI